MFVIIFVFANCLFSFNFVKMFLFIYRFIAWIDVAAAGNNPNAPVMPYFAVFMSLWSTLMLEYWKRNEKM